MLKIITESASDLGKDIAAEINVGMIPLMVFFGEKHIPMGMISTRWSCLISSRKMVTCPKHRHQPYLISSKLLDRRKRVSIGFSSKLSATIQNVHLALQNLPAGKVRIVDSLNLSTGIG